MSILSDYAVQMDTADADGTAITGASLAILNNGSHGFSTAAWAITGTPGATVESGSTARPSTIRVRGTGATYLPAATHRRVKVSHSNSFAYFTLGSPALTRTSCASVRCLVTPGMTNKGAGLGAVFDLLRFAGSSGSSFAIAQLLNGDATGRYVIGLHSNPGGASQRINDFVVTPGVAIWLELAVNFTTATCTLVIYDVSGNVLTSASANTNTGGTGAAGLDFGNSEVGVDAGTFTFFDGMDIEFTKGEIQGIANTRDVFVPKFSTGVDNASTTTLTATVPNCKPGDMAYGFLGLAGSNTPASVTLTTPTDILAMNQAGIVINVSGTPPSCVTFFNPCIQASGSVVFTATCSVAADFKDLLIVVLEPPSTSWVFTTGSPPIFGSASSGTAYATKVQQMIMAGGSVAFDFACYAEFGATMTLPLILGASDLDLRFQPGTNDRSAVWMRRRTGPAIGASTGTLSASNSWTGITDSFVATLGRPVTRPVARQQRMVRC